MVLETVLRKNKEAGWGLEFQRKAAKEKTSAWMMGKGEDLRWPEVTSNGKSADLPNREK